MRWNGLLFEIQLSSLPLQGRPCIVRRNHKQMFMQNEMRYAACVAVTGFAKLS